MKCLIRIDVPVIQERSGLGLDHIDVAERLEPYAELPMKTDRASEAARLLARRRHGARNLMAPMNDSAFERVWFESTEIAIWSGGSDGSIP